MTPNWRGWARLACVAAAAALLAGGTLRAQQAATPSAREIVDRFVREAGGEAAFKAIKSMRARGKLSIAAQGISGDVETLSARPAKLISRMTVPSIGKVEEGYDGKIGWSLDPVNGPALVTGKALIERADESYFDAALHAPGYVKDMTVVGRQEFDKRQAYQLKVVLSSGNEQMEFFDVETGLQIGLEATRETPFGSAPVTLIYRDYQKFGAVRLPTSQIQRILGIEQIATFSSFEFDVVPSSAFDLPPAIKALLK